MSPHSAAAARTPGGSAEELDLLALAYGIEPEFTDVHGILRRTEPATKRALLDALSRQAQADVENLLRRWTAAAAALSEGKGVEIPGEGSRRL